MSVVRTILCPVDFSEATPPTIEYAKSLAASLGASLAVLHVTRPMERFAALDISLDDIQRFAKELHSGALEKMEQLKATHFPDQEVVTAVKSGYPPEVINSYAASSQADLLVMATHGYAGLKRMIFGSVAEKVVKTSPVPVLTFRPPALD